MEWGDTRRLLLLNCTSLRVLLWLTWIGGGAWRRGFRLRLKKESAQRKELSSEVQYLVGGGGWRVLTAWCLYVEPLWMRCVRAWCSLVERRVSAWFWLKGRCCQPVGGVCDHLRELTHDRDSTPPQLSMRRGECERVVVLWSRHNSVVPGVAAGGGWRLCLRARPVCGRGGELSERRVWSEEDVSQMRGGLIRLRSVTTIYDVARS